jgi:hypothetical protein
VMTDFVTELQQELSRRQWWSNNLYKPKKQLIWFESSSLAYSFYYVFLLLCSI